MHLSSATDDSVLANLPSDVERDRYKTLLSTLSGWDRFFVGRRVLDFGASYGTSLIALLRLGADEVVGVEPDPSRVERGQRLLAEAVPGANASLLYTPDTSELPFNSGEFSFILANAVFEHIPQPRDAFVRELWRLLAAGGYLFINETPNKYFPKEMHTTGLWFNHWLPKSLAHRRAVRRGRFDPERTDWRSSGWRGLGYLELVKPLSSYDLIPERSRLRHRVFEVMGVPPSILDPYPTWVLRKKQPVHGNTSPPSHIE